MSKKHSSIWLLLVAIGLTLLLAGCKNSGKVEAPAPAAQPAATLASSSASETPLPSGANPAPLSLRVENALRPTIDPACLEGDADTFQIRSAPLPAAGLEPGFNYLFCAVGAGDSATVDFILVNPEGVERTYQATSFVQDGMTVAPLSLRLTPADPAGTWTLKAQSAGLVAQISFNVQPPSRPFIALGEPIVDNAQLIRAGIGGLPPNGAARFALYSFTDLRRTQPDVADAVLLISTRLAADDTGRADLELDVADLPAGPYLLLLLPADVDLGTPPTIHLPEQENLVIAANITRPQTEDKPGVPAEEAGTSPESAPLVSAEEAIPPEPQPVANGGGLPEIFHVNLPAAQLPACEQTNAPQLQLWPSAGEIGQWWYGCASGFSPGETIQFTVKQANGQRTVFPITAGASGTAPFRWYSAPGEGAGEYRIVAQAASGKATLNFTIDSTSNPHILVFPHDFRTSIGGELYLSGFPAQSTVPLALYRLDKQGNGVKIKEWNVKTNKWGAYKADFIQAFGLDAGRYAVIAQGATAYRFSGIDLAVSAIDFFSYNDTPDPALEFYTLYVGRTEGALIAREPEPATPAPLPTATSIPPTPGPDALTPIPATATSVPSEIPPLTVSIDEDVSTPPTCPDIPAGQPGICLVPNIVPRGTFVAMIMHDFSPGTTFRITITPPNGVRVILSEKAGANGYSDAFWYALNDEKLGKYKVSIRGGGQKFSSSFTIVKPQQPHVVIQPQAPEAGTPVIISVAGFEPREELLIARYQSTGTENGQVQFKRLDVTSLTTGGIGGGQELFRTRAKQQGQLFLVRIYRPGQPEALAQAVYQVGKPLNMHYSFAWAQNFQEGQ